jgi:tetratricopeptide (TPR) repeat protein
VSLLLEALKKAELAKQAAKESPPIEGEPPFTRDKLPDISQPMEIHSEDLRLAESEPAARRMEKPPLELSPEQPSPPTSPVKTSYSAPNGTAYSPLDETAERKQAQQLFEAKELDVNPRKPFYLTVGALGLFALGTVGYFWYQLQPKTTFRPPPPSAQSALPPIAAAPAAARDTPAAAIVVPPDASQSAVPATGDSAPRTAPAATPASAPAAVPAASRGPVFARQSAPAGIAATAPRPSPAQRESDITITPARVQSDPILEGAFQAFNAGNLAKAREDYLQVRRNNPDSRDALLGLAAVETQAKRYDAADRYYTRLLELDPRDAYAQAGLIGLRGQVDPVAAESRLKSMIASQPDASFLHFTLGNQYAAQGRWAEAQQAYFQAYASDPEHPDFAYNLAISLDRMHQSKSALEYYRKALTLAQGRPVSFDRTQVSNRVSQLER